MTIVNGVKWVEPNSDVKKEVKELANMPKFSKYSKETLYFLAARGINTDKKLDEILAGNIAKLKVNRNYNPITKKTDVSYTISDPNLISPVYLNEQGNVILMPDTDQPVYKSEHEMVSEIISGQFDPAVMKDSNKFVDTLNKLVNESKHPLNVVIYGDYDADGITATTVMMRGLKLIYDQKINVDYFINNRFKLGYGLNPQGMQQLLKQFPKTDVIITVDNGIVAFDGVEEAVKNGVKVLITDHHLPHPSGKLPDALAIVDPHQEDDEYPFEDICGCVVAWKLMQLAAKKYNSEKLSAIIDLVDFCGISTLSDVMPLRSENRLFVKALIYKLNHRKPGNSNSWGSRYSLNALLSALKKTPDFNEETIKFYLAPAINASARVTGESRLVVDMLNSKNSFDVIEKANKLAKINEERKATTNEILDNIDKNNLIDTSKKLIVYYDENIGDGIIGLVAGKLTEQYHRPSIVLTHDGDIYKGSGRSIEGFDITHALYAINQPRNGLIQFGGHVGACGLSVSSTKIEAFTKAIQDYADKNLSDDLMQKKVNVDIIFNDENTKLLEETQELDQFRPFGESFEEPLVEFQNHHIVANQLMGKGKSDEERVHEKLLAKNIVMNYFNGRKYYEKYIAPESKAVNVDVLGTLSLSAFGGNVRPDFQVLDDNITLAF